MNFCWKKKQNEENDYWIINLYTELTFLFLLTTLNKTKTL